MELIITSAMEDIKGLEYTVKMRVKADYHAHISNETYWNRMYLEYAGRGDLADLIKSYNKRDEFIPEASLKVGIPCLSFGPGF